MQGVNSAADIVKYCQSRPMFREVNMTRYLAATTTKRVFCHVTRGQVETPESLRLFHTRTVSTYAGEKNAKKAQSHTSLPSLQV